MLRRKTRVKNAFLSKQLKNCEKTVYNTSCRRYPIRQSWNEHSVDGSPLSPILHMEGGVAYEKTHTKNLDLNDPIFCTFPYKSKLVAHTAKCSD